MPTDNLEAFKINEEFVKGVDATIDAIVKRKCVRCGRDLDREFGKRGWRIPLCRDHRIMWMNSNIKLTKKQEKELEKSLMARGHTYNEKEHKGRYPSF